MPAVVVGVGHWLGFGLCGDLQGAADSEKFFLGPSNLVVDINRTGHRLSRLHSDRGNMAIWDRKLGVQPWLLR